MPMLVVERFCQELPCSTSLPNIRRHFFFFSPPTLLLFFYHTHSNNDYVTQYWLFAVLPATQLSYCTWPYQENPSCLALTGHFGFCPHGSPHGRQSTLPCGQEYKRVHRLCPVRGSAWLCGWGLTFLMNNMKDVMVHDVLILTHKFEIHLYLLTQHYYHGHYLNSVPLNMYAPTIWSENPLYAKWHL